MLTPDDTAVFAQVAIVAVSTVGALSGIGVAVHAYLARVRRRDASLAPPLEADPLRHLERAVDTIAVEVERIAESQRYMLQLQTPRDGDPTVGR